MDKKSLINLALRCLQVAKYGVAGALGATAIVEVLPLAADSVLATPTAVNIASTVGAVLMAGAAKLAHLV